MSDLVVTVHRIAGHCPVYRVGDRFLIRDGYQLQASTPVCLHVLGSLMPYYVALSRGVAPCDLGLGQGPTAYVQCLDPVAYTGGGTVTFAITRSMPTGG